VEDCSEGDDGLSLELATSRAPGKKRAIARMTTLGKQFA
ncbi:Superfamily II DNA and RNA helicase, partial [Giardia duodenalis]